MAKLIKADGTNSDVIPADGHSFTLAELQKMVGGYIETQEREYIGTFVFDEEGNLKGKEPNYMATILLGKILVGDVLICTKNELGDDD
jgi:hypothetical protein